MLVTFHSNAGTTISMFGDVAVTLLKMMGHSGTVPSALLAGDIPLALARLQQGLAVSAEDESNKSARRRAGNTDTASPAGLRLRAYPLIQLLSAAARQGCDVLWDEGAPLG